MVITSECNTDVDRLSVPRFPDRGDLAAAAVYLLLMLVVYHKVWLHGQLFFGDDLSQYHGPYLQYLAQRLTNWSLPHWNPYLYGGTPFIASPQAGVFYPPNWIALFVRPEVATTLLSAGHLALAGCLMHACCRIALKLRPLAAFVGAVIFSFAGNLPGHFEHTAVIMSGSWLPGIFLACYYGYSTGRLLCHLLAGAMLGLGILAGGVQVVYLSCVMVFVLVAYQIVWPLRHPQSTYAAAMESSKEAIPGDKAQHPRIGIRVGSFARHLRDSVFSFVIMAIVAAAVGCAQLLPTIRFIPISQRSSGMDFSSATVYSLPPRYAVLFAICPEIFGGPDISYWGNWSQTELSMYLGIAPLSLAPLALLYVFRRRVVTLLAWIALCSLILAFGSYTPVYRLAYEIMPGLSFFRVPARFLFLFSFAGAALTAIAVNDRLVAQWKTHTALVLGLVAFWVLIGIWGFRFVTEPGLVDRLVRLSFDDSASNQVFARFKLQEYFKSTDAVYEHYWQVFLKVIGVASLATAAIALARLRPQWGSLAFAAVLCLDVLAFSRALPVWARPGEGQDYVQIPDWARTLRGDIGKYRCALPETMLPRNAGLWYDLPVLDGYDPFLPQHRHTELAKARAEDDPKFVHRLRQLFSVKYLATQMPISNGTGAYRDLTESIRIIENLDSPPRAQLFGTAEIVHDTDEALNRLLDPDFDPRQRLIVEPSSVASPAAADPALTRPNAIELQQDDRPNRAIESSPGDKSDEPSVHWVRDEPEYLKIEVQSKSPGWLLVSDAYWPDWRAKVNSQEIAIRRANFYFRAVPVPAGASVVEMTFSDWTIWIGISVTVAACVLIAAMFIVQARSKSRPELGRT